MLEGEELLVWYDEQTYLQFMGIPLGLKIEQKLKITTNHVSEMDFRYVAGKKEGLFDMEKESESLKPKTVNNK